MYVCVLECIHRYVCIHVYNLHVQAYLFSFYWKIRVYNFVLVSAVQQWESVTVVYISTSSRTFLLSPIPPIQIVTESQAGLPVLNSNFPLAIYVTHNIIYMSCYFLNSSHPLFLLLFRKSMNGFLKTSWHLQTSSHPSPGITLTVNSVAEIFWSCYESCFIENLSSCSFS